MTSNRGSSAVADHDVSDEELVLGTRDGDIASVEALYVRHHRGTVGYALRLTRDRCKAEDLASDAFLRLWEAVRSGRTPGKPGAYLRRTVHNLFIDQVRRDARLSDQDPTEEHLHGASAVSDIASGVVERDALSRAASTLCVSQQEILWETAVEGYSTQEAAQRRGLASANAGAQFAYRARRSLRTAYDAHCA